MTLPDHLVKLNDYAHYRGVDQSTVRNWIAQGYFPAYRAPGARGILVDLDEAEAALAKLPNVGRPYARYGANAKIIDLTKVMS